MTGTSPVDRAGAVRWVLMDSVAALTVLHLSRADSDAMSNNTSLEGKGATRVRPGGPSPLRPLARPRCYARSRPSVEVGKAYRPMSWKPLLALLSSTVKL